ncbi:uncharacterized protein LOC126704666 [Quercus robur]|uniref:uncharacterized protein LOC126704666 n=1 Tax=Quercus robur TaxID=38942 RepID=UPI002163A3D5|nr:uncharacterized protein LOC126704666 [Quercus robur]
MWLLHPDFYRIVKEAWPNEAQLQMAIPEFTRKARKWNFEVFGNLFGKKKRVLARLQGTQKALADNPNESLMRLENQLIEEYSSILLQEEEFWALKSRINVAAFGDRNTSFFHLNTVVRRQRNKIRCLKDNMGEWIVEEEAVQEHILNGFKKLYSTDFEMSYKISQVADFSSSFLTEVDRNWMGREVTDEDVRNGLWALKPFKAPGPDGLHVGFFQHFWHEVRNPICKEVKNIFRDGVVPDYLNDTLVTLIPKCKSPESLNNYRPISLCNSVYKIVSKILVERIRPHLNKLVSPVQSAFVPRRKGLDNILIAQELFYALDGKKGKEGYMAIKIDLEKAYDRLEWCFIHKEWKWEVLSFEIPPCIKDRIKAIPRRLVDSGEDVIMWKFSKDGEFTTKSTYALLNGAQQNAVPFQGQWALRDGLLLADQIGVQNLVIELDAKVVVELVQSKTTSNAFYSSLLADCRSLLGKFQHFKVQHVFREVNRVADALANLGCSMQENFVVMDSSPSDVVANFVYSDAMGENLCRLTANNLAILA